jgi:hypothetical protein
MAAERWAQENAPRDERCSFCRQIPPGPVELVCTSPPGAGDVLCICKACVDNLSDFFKQGRYGPWARSEGVTL